jgi:hypothetical protein
MTPRIDAMKHTQIEFASKPDNITKLQFLAIPTVEYSQKC